MKRLIAYLSIFVIIGLSSCNVQPIDNYEGGIVYDRKYDQVLQNFIITIKIQDDEDTTKHEFVTIYVMSYDYNNYSIGDTIK